MAVLAPLELIGAGTHCVESLESYGARIAYVHCVEPARVFALARDVANAVREGPKLRGFSYQTICGYGRHTAWLIRGLQRLTKKENLGAGTLAPLEAVLAKGLSGVFANSRRWCPVCYLRPQVDRYDLLAWQLGTTYHCPRDGVRLVAHCRKCRATQPDFQTIDTERYRCRVCRSPLGWVPVAEPSETSWERWSNLQSGDLIDFTSKCPAPIEGNPWCEFLTLLRQQKSVPPDMSIDVFRAFAWKSNRNRPRLSTVFQYAALQSVTPLQILQDPVGASSATLPFAKHGVVEERRRVQRLTRNQRHLQYTASVLAEAEHDLPLPSPGWLAKCFGGCRPNWSTSDPGGYSRYKVAHSKHWPDMQSPSDQLYFSMAISDVQSALGVGGTKTVADVIDEIACGKPGRDRSRVVRAVLSSLLVIGIYRRLRPNERMEFSVGRICAKTKL